MKKVPTPAQQQQPQFSVCGNQFKSVQNPAVQKPQQKPAVTSSKNNQQQKINKPSQVNQKQSSKQNNTQDNKKQIINQQKQDQKQPEQKEQVQNVQKEQQPQIQNAQELKNQNIKDEQQVQIQQVQKEIKKEPVKGLVTLKYNHYNDKFEIIDGKISYENIDEKYYFSTVFQGNFIIKIKNLKNKEYLPQENKIISDLQDGETYQIEIQEDEAEESKRPQKVYNAPKQENNKTNGYNNRQEAITNELKKMTIEQLKEKGDKYKELIEARDLEDCLYK